MDFEWDASKADENMRKHNVSFAEAVETFADLHGFALDDVKHSRSEKRYYKCSETTDSRLERVEKELKQLKRKLAA